MSVAQFPAIAGLADRLRSIDGGLTEQWALAHDSFVEWSAGYPDLLDQLREQLRALPPEAVTALGTRSRETTTHFAWRLVDEPADPFSFWLHQYKPQRDWLHGYANTVHNHRYNFCTFVLAGGYRHEWFDVRLDESGELVRSAQLAEWDNCGPGTTKLVPADRFHRIPLAKDNTTTFLVKSRAVRTWSISLDPATNVSRRHIPVEVRVAELANGI